jgi:hypothetical protein
MDINDQIGQQPTKYRRPSPYVRAGGQIQQQPYRRASTCGVGRIPRLSVPLCTVLHRWCSISPCPSLAANPGLRIVPQRWRRVRGRWWEDELHTSLDRNITPQYLSVTPPQRHSDIIDFFVQQAGRRVEAGGV